MHAVLGALGSLLPRQTPGGRGPFSLSADGALEALVEAAGMRPERTIDTPTPYASTDVPTAVRGLLASGPGRQAIATAGEGSAWAAIYSAFDSYRRPGGRVALHNVFRTVIART